MEGGEIVEVFNGKQPAKYNIYVCMYMNIPCPYSTFSSLIQMGSHSELLRRDGLYSRLTRRQADAVATP